MHRSSRRRFVVTAGAVVATVTAGCTDVLEGVDSIEENGDGETGKVEYVTVEADVHLEDGETAGAQQAAAEAQQAATEAQQAATEADAEEEFAKAVRSTRSTSTVPS